MQIWINYSFIRYRSIPRRREFLNSKYAPSLQYETEYAEKGLINYSIYRLLDIFHVPMLESTLEIRVLASGITTGNKDNKMVFQLLNISHQVKVNGREED